MVYKLNKIGSLVLQVNNLQVDMKLVPWPVVVFHCQEKHRPLLLIAGHCRYLLPGGGPHLPSSAGPVHLVRAVVHLVRAVPLRV